MLNFASALSPDLPHDEFYELTVHQLSVLSEYPSVVLWTRTHQDQQMQLMAANNVSSTQMTALRGRNWNTELVAALRGASRRMGEIVWWPHDAPPSTPNQALLAFGKPGYHALLVPLVYTEMVGVALFVGPDHEPDSEQVTFIQQCADQVAIALTAARMVAENLRIQAELRSLLVQQEQLIAQIVALSAPVLPLLPEVVFLPLVGNLDAERMNRTSEALLAAVSAERAKVVLIDITGIAVIDTQVAGALLNAARSLKLLGAKAVLVGIRPEIAQMLVSLGVNLDELITRATLSQGLQAALSLVGLRLDSK